MAMATEIVAHPTSEEKLSVGEKVGYALGDAASNLFWKMFEFFLMYFYTDVFGRHHVADHAHLGRHQ